MNQKPPMNVRDIQATFDQMRMAMSSQRNVIVQLQAEMGQLRQTQAEVEKLKKEVSELAAKVDELDSSGNDCDVEDAVLVESSSG